MTFFNKNNLSEGVLNFCKEHKIEIAIFLLAVAVRSLLFFINLDHNQGDLITTIRGDDGYYEISKSLVEGIGFGHLDASGLFVPNPLRPPVYPFFIAGILYFFKSYWVVLVTQILIASMIPVLGMYIVRKFTQVKALVYITGVLLALEPYAILFSFIFYTETLFIFLFFIFLLFFLSYFKDNSWRNIIWSAVFLGLAVLVKPTIQYLPIVIPLFLLWHFRKSPLKKTITQLVVFVGVFMLVISPWLYRNYKEFGVVGMSAQPAFNLNIYLVPSVLSIENKTSFAIELRNIEKKEGFDQNNITLATSDYYVKQAVDVLKEHPVALLKSIGITSVTFFTHDGMLTVLQYSGYTPQNYLSRPALLMLFDDFSGLVIAIKGVISSPMVLVLLVRVFWIIMTLLFFVGVVRFLRDKKPNTLVIFALFLVMYFVATTAINGLGVNARFRMPVNVFIFFFATYGFLRTINDVRLFKNKNRHKVIQ